MALQFSDWEIAIMEDAVTMYFQHLKSKNEAYKDLSELGKKLELYVYGCRQEPIDQWNIECPTCHQKKKRVKRAGEP